MKGVFGGILLGVGILIAGASGICTVGAMFMGGSAQETLSMAPMVLAFGGIPFAIGAALVYVGRMLLREAKSEREGE